MSSRKIARYGLFVSLLCVGWIGWTQAEPVVHLVSPVDDSTLNRSNVTFTVNATDAVGLTGATLYIGNSQQVVTFSGPSAIIDAQIDATYPSTNFGGAVSINVDGATPHAHGAIKFPNLIGNGAGQIPLGTTVVSASLRLNCTNLGAMMKVYRLTKDWSEDTVTWNSPWSTPGGDYDSAVEVNGDCTATGLRTIDVTDFVQAWATGANNYGILLTDTGADGIDFDSSEGAIPPLLTVVYFGEWQPVQSQPLSGTSTTVTFADVPLQDQTAYIWNCLVTNSNSISSWAPATYGFSIDLSIPDQPTLVAPSHGATGVTVPTTLTVNVSDPRNNPLTVSFYGRRNVSTAGAFTIVALPDTQKYVLNAAFPQILTAQTQWIVANKNALNIVFVTHEGDMVDTYSDTNQWNLVNNSMSLLDNEVPYGVLPGNHDHPTENYNIYFPYTRYTGKSWYGGHYPSSGNDNSYQLISAGGVDFLMLQLAYAPASDDLAWAGTVLTNHPGRTAIITTHSFLNTDGSRTAEGSTIWNNLVVPHENVHLVLCGHMHDEFTRIDPTPDGREVPQLLADYQARSNGGDGWLRILRFVPAENRVYVKTYSPWLNRYETDANSEFVLDMPLNPFTQIAANANVASGSNTSAVWSDPTPGAVNEWFVEVSNGIRTTTGPAWTFTAEVNGKPIAISQNIATPEDTPVSITLTGTDADNDPLTYAVATGPAHGTLSGSTPNLIYTPAADFNGTDSFTFTASDGSLVSEPATITLTVNSVNDAPVAQSQSVAVRINTPKAIVLTGSDPDSDPLTFAVATSPASGALSGTAPTLTYTPAANFNGTDSFTFTVNDGTIDSAVATVSITIASNNSPVANPDSYSVAEDTTLSIDAISGILANDSDADGDPLTSVLIVSTTKGQLTLNTDGSFTYIPSNNVTGSDSFTYKASDGPAQSAETTVAIAINPVNDAPTAGAQTVTTNEDASTGITLSGSDPDGDLLTFAVVTPPAYGALSGTIPALTYTPTANYNGADSFTFTVSDGVETSEPAGVSITILPQADAPFAGDDAVSTNAGVSVTIFVLANDTDPDGGTLTLGAVGTPGHGTAVGNGDGTITYTPDPGFWGQDSFTYTASDGLLKSAAATVTITIAEPILFSEGFEGGNLTAGGWVYNSQVTVDPSAAHIGTYGALLKKTASLQKTINTEGATTVNLEFYARVASLTGRNLVVEWSVNGNTWVSLLTLTGTTQWPATPYSYTLDLGTNSQLMLRFRTNGTSGNQMAMIDDVVITIPTPPVPNTPPVAADDSYSIAEDGVLSIVASGVLANDVDMDGNPLTAAVTAGTSHGTLVLNLDGSFTYTPNANYNGTDSFTYTASDDKGGSDIATVTLTITSVNDNPVAVNDTGTTQQDLFVVINVLANDSDADGDVLTIVSFVPPTNGSAVNNGNGTITYTPATGITGPDSFDYAISDGNGGIAAGTVSVTVYRINTLPVAVDDSAITDEEQPIAISVLTNDSDLDGDSLTVTGVTNPANGTAVANIDGSITYNPAANFNGTDSFTYTINDGNGGTATATVNLTVNAVNDNPVAVDDAATTQQDTAITIGVLSNDSDIDGDPLRITGVTQPLNGNVTINTDGTITYTPNIGYSGTASFTYTVSDSSNGTAAGTVTITVQPVSNNTITVASIVMSGKKAGKSYFAQAVVTISNPVAGAVVSGKWSLNGSDMSTTTFSASTADNGTVTFNSPKVSTGGTFRFEVTSIVLDGYTYTVPNPPDSGEVIYP